MPSVAASMPDARGAPSIGLAGRRSLPQGSIHPAIAHALSASAPTVASRAESVIRALLEERLADPSPGAWQSSRLTGDGFPFEVAFSHADSRLRFTLEPGRADADPRTRLAIAVEALGRVAGEPVPDGVARHLAAMQSSRSLRFGAWVGARVGPTDTAFKLYAEVPPDAPVMRLVDRPIALGDRTAARRMVAYSPATRTFESYVRVPSLEPRHLRAVLSPADREADASRLLEIIEHACGNRLRERLPGPSVGVSYRTGPGAPIVSLHLYARALWGSDARIRRGFERMGRAVGWDPGPYLEVTAPLAAREDWRTFHGIFSISLEPADAVAFAIGLRPVAW